MRRLLLLLFVALPARADDKPVSFVRDVRPILAKNCFGCHGPDEKARKAKLRLDVEESAKAVIVPGDVDASDLVKRITAEGDDRMPPPKTAKALLPEQVEVISRWVKQGAKWGRHWAFEKPTRPPLPDVQAADWAKNPIDRFVLARLEKDGLAPSPEADKYTLARRVALDLTGLPPETGLVKRFVEDGSPEAYEHLVDDLLKSPAYGERWARMWLDLARYADTKGYEKDLGRTMWRYRDWVIEAFNKDQPYDQFTRNQLAGDLVPGATLDQLLATAFHRNTMINEEGGTDREEFRVAAVKDRVDTTMQVWMGLTAGCAKCHSHKYDPISQKEYYQLYAFFNQTEDADTADEAPKVPTPTKAQEEQIAKLQAEWMRVRNEMYTYSDEFKAAAAKWEEGAKKRGGWTIAKPTVLAAASGSSMRVIDDNSILVEARRPARETYTVTLSAGPGPITGIRLEVLPDPSHPRGGVGRTENDGNFVLSRFAVRAKAKDGKLTDVPIASATADFAQDQFPVEHAIKNPDPKKHGWAVAPKQLEIHQAVFALAEPFTPVAGTELEVTLDHQFEFTYPGFSVGRFRLFLTGDEGPSATGELPAELRTIFLVPPERRTADQQAAVWAYYAGLAADKKPLRDKLATLQKEIEAVPAPQTPILRDLPANKQRTTKVHNRGNFLDQGEAVEPAVPASFQPLPVDAPKDRFGLAAWVVHPDNPLTARVAVNRFWAHLFGRGLVETQEDFGSQGQSPSHPELLDWLAVEFREKGWSMKGLLKTVVMSATYRQSSRVTPELLKRDSTNRLLARGPRFRLEAELIRDESLAASGLLSKKMFGPSVMPPQPDGLWKSAYSGEKWVTATGEDRYRRGIYTYVKRTAPYPAMTTFDAPSRELCTVRRVNTNTPLQALVTLNDTAFVEMAQALARKMQAAGKSPEEQIAHGLQRALVRPAKPDEVAVLKDLYGARLTAAKDHPDEAKKLAADAELAALTAVANVILNLDEFFNPAMNLHHEYARYVTRRHFFRNCAVGLGAIALAELRARGQTPVALAPGSPLAPRKPHHPAKAKAVIYLHMAGSPSQLDLFDYKPELVKFNGKPCPKEYLEGKRFAFIRGVPNMLGTPFKFDKHGAAGAELSELWKHLPEVVDDLAIVKSCVTDQFNHAPAQLYLQTGTNLLGGASIGSWATYGLGSENQNLPGFVVLTSGGKSPDAGKSVWGSGFLPGIYQGVQCRSPGDPVLFLSNPPGLDRDGRRQTLDALAKLNKMQAVALGDPETLTRIEQYELAFRMQMEVPKVMDISKEPQEVLDLYGAQPGYVSPAEGATDPRTLYKGTDPTIANNCLLARRLVEVGVRYVQLYDWGWDHHGISPGEDIPHTLPIKTQQVDRALTGLIKDLKRTGLLDSTLVIWGGEFGRTPMQQNSPGQPYVGRDHHPHAFTTLMAGGGIRGGQTYGKTDDIGYYVAEDPFDVRDLQATILHLLGLDPFKLTFEEKGLAQRLIGVEGKAKLHPKLLA